MMLHAAVVTEAGNEIFESQPQRNHQWQSLVPIPRPDQSCWETLAGQPLRIHFSVSEDLSLGYLLHGDLPPGPLGYQLPVAMVTIICKCLERSGYQHYWGYSAPLLPFWDTQWVLLSNLTGPILRGW